MSNVNLQGNNLRIASGAGGASFVNSGTLQKTQSLLADQANVDVPFSNTGTVQVQTGILAFNNSFSQTTAGVLDVRANGGGEMRGGDMSILAGTLQGDGILRVTGNNGTLDWKATMNGTGKVIVDLGATMYLVGAFTDSGFTITNNSVIEWDAGNVTLNNGAVINNQAGDTFESLANATMNNTAGAATFNNYGRVAKFQAVGQQWGSMEFQVAFNSLTAAGQQPSVVDAEFGSIGLRSGGTFQASVIAALGCQVEFGSLAQSFTLLDGTTFNGAGTVRITGAGTLAIANNANVTNHGNFQIGDFDLRLPTFQATGQLTGSGVFRNNGTFNWNRGNLLNVVEVQNYGQLNLAPEDANNPILLSSSVLRNYAGGVMIWTGFDIQMTSPNQNQQSKIDNLGQGTFDVRNDRTLREDQNPNNRSAGFVNEVGGLFQKSAGNATTTVEVAFTTSGTVDLQGHNVTFAKSVTQTGGNTYVGNGTLTAAAYLLTGTGGTLDLGDNGQGTLVVAFGFSITQGNTFSGIGTVNGSVGNSGIINVGAGGAPVGLLTINGDFAQSTTGSLRLRLQAVLNQQYDRVNVTGTANLAGTLQVRALAGFNPAAGDPFAILTYAQHVGDFASYSLPTLNAPRAWAPASAGNTGITLTVQ